MVLMAKRQKSPELADSVICKKDCDLGIMAVCGSGCDSLQS